MFVNNITTNKKMSAVLPHYTDILKIDIEMILLIRQPKTNGDIFVGSSRIL